VRRGGGPIEKAGELRKEKRKIDDRERETVNERTSGDSN
jgi:hypothetical protein